MNLSIQNIQKWPIQKWAILIGILCLLIVALAVYSTLYSVKDILYETFAAILGVVLTACVTVLLLRGQSDQEAEQERTSKVFEEKLQIYKEFLEALCEILKDGILTKEEYMRMQFQFATITQHTTPANAMMVSIAIAEIMNDLQESKDEMPKKLMGRLLEIVNVFRIELYEDKDIENMTNEDKEKLLFNFSEMRGAVENLSEDSSEEGDQQEGAEEQGESVDMPSAIRTLVSKVKDELTAWAEKEGVTVEFDTNVYAQERGMILRVTSPVIGSDPIKDFFRWRFIRNKEAAINIYQFGIEDRTARRAIFEKIKAFGYPATYSTNNGATVYPKSRNERHIYPVKIGETTYEGAQDRIIHQDPQLIRYYADWIKDVYRKFSMIKS